MKGPQYWWQFFNPFFDVRLEPIKDSGLQSLKDHAIWVLHLTIALRVWHWGIINFNAWICTKVLELSHSELSPIINYNVVGNTKYVHDFFDEFHRLGHCDWSTSFTSIHFVNLSTTIKMCVNPPLTFLNGPTKSSLHVEKGQVIGMVCSWWDGTCFRRVKN
jgi:hypothetical protein